jgi:hypothetical protein
MMPGIAVGKHPREGCGCDQEEELQHADHHAWTLPIAGSFVFEPHPLSALAYEIVALQQQTG